MTDNELWKKWQATAKRIYSSPDDAYGRHIEIERVVWECRFCKEEKPVLSIDTSDGEYLALQCCGSCFNKILEAE